MSRAPRSNDPAMSRAVAGKPQLAGGFLCSGTGPSKIIIPLGNNTYSFRLSRSYAHCALSDGAATTFSVQEGRREMINGFTLHETTTAPAASAEILSGVQKAWGFVPSLHRVLAESPAALEAYSTLWALPRRRISRRRSATSS